MDFARLQFFGKKSNFLLGKADEDQSGETYKNIFNLLKLSGEM